MSNRETFPKRVTGSTATVPASRSVSQRVGSAAGIGCLLLFALVWAVMTVSLAIWAVRTVAIGG